MQHHALAIGFLSKKALAAIGQKEWT